MGHHHDFQQYDDRDPIGRGDRGARRRQHRGGPWGPGGPWGGWAQWGDAARGGRGGPGMPPPWLAGLFGMGGPQPGRGPRARRGDVRSAILDILRSAAEREESPNGYQVIQQIAERSGGAWKPSPGSVYPTVQQLQDEGLVELDEARGHRALRLTEDGIAWCTEHGEELAAVWGPFDRGQPAGAQQHGDHADIKSEIGQVMSAVWQIVTAGSDAQRRGAVEVLVEARRKLYGILADGPAPDDVADDPAEDPAAGSGGDDQER